MRSGTQTHVCRDSCKQYVATTPALSGSRDAVILRVQPRQNGSDEPFTGHVLRFIRSVGQPEARFNVAAEASCLRSLCSQERVKILVSNKTLYIEESGVGPIRSYKEIG